MNKALFGVFLIKIVAAAQTPPDQSRQIELQKEKERERLRQIAARFLPVIIGFPTLVRSVRSERKWRINDRFYQSSAGSNVDCRRAFAATAATVRIDYRRQAIGVGVDVGVARVDQASVAILELESDLAYLSV